jgi:hypothetical protein
MADILLDTESTPGTPASGQSYIWVDSTTKRLVQTDDGGVHRGILAKTNTVTTQALGSAADTYITNSALTIPSFGMVAGMLFRWNVYFTQTATANTFVVKVRIGSAKTVAGDTDISNTLATTVTNGATAGGGTFIIQYLVHTVAASAAGTMSYSYQFGVTTIQSASVTAATAYDNTARGGQFVGISLTPSATSATINGVHGELIS